MNAIGVGCAAAFLIASVVVMWCYFEMQRYTKPDNRYALDFDNPKLRQLFAIFVGFCALGVLSVLTGLLVGGWPRE